MKRILAVVAGFGFGAAALWLAASAFYRPSLVVGIAVGLIAASWFLVAHRPTRWWRIEALDAAGLTIALWVLYTRSAVLLGLSWPPNDPKTVWQALFSLGMLVAVDAFLIVKVVSFRRFVRRDRLGLPQPGVPVTQQQAAAMSRHIEDLQHELREANATIDQLLKQMRIDRNP